MSKPLAVSTPSGVVYQFFRGSGPSHDVEFPDNPKPDDKGRPVVRTEHWLSPTIFDALAGGTLSPQLGIRTYATEDAATAALRKAGGR